MAQPQDAGSGSVAIDRPVVVVSQRLGPIGDDERRLEAAGAEVRSAPLWTLDDMAANGADADIIILGAVEPMNASALAALPRCQAVVRRGVGHDNVDADAATRLGIVVANVPDASVDEVSDHALALLLALERRVVALDRAVHDGLWQHDPSGIGLVRGGIRRLGELTLGVIGYGRIGRELVRKATPIYRRILVSDPAIDAATGGGPGVEVVGLAELLATADHLSVHAPLLPSTHHLIDERSLATVRPGAILVNTSRGGLVDEAAVIRAVRERRLGAAGLDVTEHEPVPSDDPLLAVGDIVLTAHSAASSATAGRELGRRSVDAALAILAGRRPDSVVNPDVLDAPQLRAAALRAGP